MVRDLYARDRAAKVLSMLMTVMAVAPLLGPSVGALILSATSWQAIFWTLVAIGGGTVLAILKLPETLPADERHPDTILQAVAGYGSVLRNRSLLAYSAAVGFFYVGVFANIAGGAFAYISYHGLSPEQYGLVFSSSVIGLMATNWSRGLAATTCFSPAL